MRASVTLLLAVCLVAAHAAGQEREQQEAELRTRIKRLRKQLRAARGEAD